MTDQALRVVLALVCACIPGGTDLAPDTELIESGLLDSLGIVALISAIEDEFGIEFPPELLTPESFQDARVLCRVVLDTVVQTTLAGSGQRAGAKTMTELPGRTKLTRATIRTFDRPIYPGVTLADLVLPRTAAGMPFTLNTARIEVGASLQRHSHDQQEIWVITAGAGRLYRSEDTFDVSAGDIVHFMPNVEHELVNSNSEPLQLVSVYWE